MQEFRRKVIALERRRSATAAAAASHSHSSDGNSHSTPNLKGDHAAFILSPQEIDSLEIYETKGRHTAFNFNTTGLLSHREKDGNVEKSDHSNRLATPESKLAYIRHMIVQYLTCLEADVKLQLESALIIMFRLSEDEREAVMDRRKFENQNTLASITGLFDFSLS
jgi:hypothetical protein